jgi:hypothetical protein
MDAMTTDNKPATKPTNEEAHRVGVVTGSSSGIGYETAVLFAKNGFHKYATIPLFVI